MMIRHARLEEADAILALFSDEVRAGQMLPRAPEQIRTHLGDWLVAEELGQMVGCVSLVYFNQSLCEVRSLAVHPEWRGNGIASELVVAALGIAQMRRMRRVLALTRAPHLFENVGFQRDYVANFPEKVWHDCKPCPLRHACDEVALIYDFAQVPERA